MVSGDQSIGAYILVSLGDNLPYGVTDIALAYPGATWLLVTPVVALVVFLSVSRNWRLAFFAGLLGRGLKRSVAIGVLSHAALSEFNPKGQAAPWYRWPLMASAAALMIAARLTPASYIVDPASPGLQASAYFDPASDTMTLASSSGTALRFCTLDVDGRERFSLGSIGSNSPYVGNPEVTMRAPDSVARGTARTVSVDCLLPVHRTVTISGG